jgi:formylglycine-generating enzyme required for sulfatase activity
MRTPVTNALYALCVKAGECREPTNNHWHTVEYAAHPVTNVDWFQAKDYAQWVGGRLPTEAEWEKACRGTDARLYPWGNMAPTEELLNLDMENTTLVGRYSPQGDSPYGIADMEGNVLEWTADTSDEDARRILHGGAITGHASLMQCSHRSTFNPNLSFKSIGYRVVRLEHP